MNQILIEVAKATRVRKKKYVLLKKATNIRRFVVWATAFYCDIRFKRRTIGGNT
jgi:hypothetical protein